MSRLRTPVRKNDNVVVMAGRDRGKRGRVLKVFPDRNRVVVEGANVIKRHTRPNPRANVKGGIVEREGPAARVERADRLPGVRGSDANWPATARGRPQGAHLPEMRRSCGQMSRLRERYYDDVVPSLRKEFGYTNVMAVPKIERVVVNMGLGAATQNSKLIDVGSKELAGITGQQPVTRRARKSVAQFKVRQGMPIGVMVTLRRARMYEFLDRLVSIALPRVRDFRGVSPKGFDGRGNYTLGLKTS